MVWTSRVCYRKTQSSSSNLEINLKLNCILTFNLWFKGPINPDVTTPIDNVLDEAILEDKKNLDELYEDIKNILNKVKN